MIVDSRLAANCGILKVDANPRHGSGIAVPGPSASVMCFGVRALRVLDRALRSIHWTAFSLPQSAHRIVAGVQDPWYHRL